MFTFILLGRRVTVALGPKGNNFILGGKSTVFNAEDAYTVCLTLFNNHLNTHRTTLVASYDTHLRQGRCLRRP